MAIYSLHHSAIGKSTQAQPYTAAAHIRYITRPKALSHLAGERLPVKRAEAARWFRKVEDQDRKNARVADKVMLALPKELNSQEQIALVREFAEVVTMGRAGWLAAFHRRGKDARNPHCHLVIRDRDLATGKRVIGMSEAGSTERLRQLWEEHANQALEKAGRTERIDRRTLREQGVHRLPTIHEGVRAQQMHRRGARTRSRTRRYRNGWGSRRRWREINYQKIDRGRSRPEYNDAIRMRAGETDRGYWDALDADRQRRELDAQRAIHRPDLVQAIQREMPKVDRWMTSTKECHHDLDLER